ncbi:phage tail sheath subtilisin-like domain-containing protein [Achromobacter sp. AONIH1]|uniref:phage tail sheath subtilisin-like domain-containing protein n=1 Tax=Achromobacter sp. AONIH1 TaxID=1758194 RepID=UPI000CD28265|nr:phage tail sheath subtilisin-like domain-containing protein [Achromobacter sp. AONIH1]AUT47012.1 phage tail protein [Achromobacter sp. AONIH1]
MANLSFNNIPQNVRVPLFFAEVDNSRANSGATTQRALIIGQMTSSGEGTAGVPVISQGIADAKRVGGIGSMLAAMTMAYRRADNFGEVWYLPLADASAGQPGKGSVTFTSNSSDAGVLSLYIAGALVSLSVLPSQAPAALATALAGKVNGAIDLPVTAEVDGATPGKVNLTAKNKGLAAGDVDLRLNYRGSAAGEMLPAGLGITLTPMSGGQLNPLLPEALANLQDMEFDYIAMPYTDSASLDAIKTFLSTKTGRWAWSSQLYGHAFAAHRGTLGALTTFGNGRNDEHVSVIGFNDSPTPAYVWAADLAGTAASSLRVDPARPLQTLSLSTVLAPPLQSRFDLSGRNTLLWDGISTFTVGSDGTVALENVITTYRVNGFGVPDDSYLQVETLMTLTYVLRRLRAVVTSQFSRMKLASDGTRVAPGTNVVTPAIIKGALIAEYARMELDGFVQESAKFAEGLIVQKNTLNPNRVDVLYPAVLINQLRIFALLMQFSLQ